MSIESTIKSEILKLLQSHSSTDDMSFVDDDVVVGYVCGVLEDIASGDELNVTEMKDVMSAYIPAFDTLSLKEVDTWINQIIHKTLEERNKDKANSKDFSLDAIVSSFPAPVRKHKDSSSTSVSECSETSSQKLSDNSDCFEECLPKTKEDQYTESLSILMELFPGCCSMEAQHCLSSAGGNLEEATSLLLERQEQGISLKSTPIPKVLSRCSKEKDDVTIRKSILNRYGFIDNDEDDKEHRPLAPKWEGKKMIRYRDNKVVSLKGERYTEVKKDDSSAPDAKKTLVNLKPGKQYRFH